MYLNEGYTHDNHECNDTVWVEKSLMTETRYKLLHGYALAYIHDWEESTVLFA